ncbi:MAG TPA: glutathione transferase GstA [Methylophilaceae bacterium]|nr:glutathione transferase GstA [Methylophilaceae bacterium]
MKLYYAPGACSQSPHIVLREAGADFTLEKVDLKSKTTEHGENYLTVNPKGYVPALEIAPGQVLTEGPAIVQYVADKYPSAKLAPAPGTLERYHLQSWLNFITSEIHKTFSPLFNPAFSDEVKAKFREQLGKRFAYLQTHLSQQDYLLPSGFSVADAYLFVTSGWSGHVGIDLQQWPALAAYRQRIAQRPAVQAALAAEGFA